MLAAKIRRKIVARKLNELYDDLDCSSKWTNYGELWRTMASVVNEIESSQQSRLEDYLFILMKVVIVIL